MSPRRRLLVWIFLAGICILIVCWAMGILTHPGSRLGFRFYTGLWWPSNARVIARGDDHGGFHGDGEFYVVFETDEQTIQKWLSGSAPWGQEWEQGPVPGEIGFHCSFGTLGASWSTVNGESRYRGDEELVRLFSSNQTWYAARERGSSSLRWHNGDLFIVDPQAKTVWFCVWDW